MIITRFYFIKKIVQQYLLSLLCNMRLLSVSLLLLVISFSSCTSEYEERLEEAKILQARMILVEESLFSSPSKSLVQEIQKLESEIHFLAKVSGNKEMFLSELNQ